MKKLFRFKYEPCNGTCYAREPIFFKELKDLTTDRRTALVDQLVKAHDKLCDNPAYSFGVDLDEESGTFIGHFLQPERVDLVAGRTLEECALKLCDYVLATNIPQVPGLCNYGSAGQENLAEEIMLAAEQFHL